ITVSANDSSGSGAGVLERIFGSAGANTAPGLTAFAPGGIMPNSCVEPPTPGSGVGGSTSIAPPPTTCTGALGDGAATGTGTACGDVASLPGGFGLVHSCVGARSDGVTEAGVGATPNMAVGRGGVYGAGAGADDGAGEGATPNIAVGRGS